MSPDSDGGEEDQPMPVDRDPQSEEIVRNLERGLPRWAGFSELGWMEYATPERLIDLVHSIKSHKDHV
jgi:chromatin structure-remodeling complex subunit RSC1/2